MQEGQQDLFEVRKQLVPAADLCASRHRGAETSVEAFATTPTSRREAQRSTILKFIRDRGSAGAICEDVETALGIPNQTASARVTDLLALGLISYGTERRNTRNGKAARVYRAALNTKGEDA